MDHVVQNGAKISDCKLTQKSTNLDQCTNKSSYYSDPLALDNPRDSDYTPPPPPKSKKAPRKTTHTLICPQCRQEFIGQRSLDTHINTIHLKLPPGRLRAPPPAPGPSGPFNCTHCGRGYQSRSSLVNHQQRAHPKLCCTSCALEFSTMSAWALHEATVCLVSGWNLSHLQKTFNLTLVPCPASECACGQLFDESDSASMQRWVNSTMPSSTISLLWWHYYRK